MKTTILFVNDLWEYRVPDSNNLESFQVGKWVFSKDNIWEKVFLQDHIPHIHDKFYITIPVLLPQCVHMI